MKWDCELLYVVEHTLREYFQEEEAEHDYSL